MPSQQTIQVINQLDALNKNTPNFTAEFFEPIYAGAVTLTTAAIVPMYFMMFMSVSVGSLYYLGYYNPWDQNNTLWPNDPLARLQNAYLLLTGTAFLATGASFLPRLYHDFQAHYNLDISGGVKAFAESYLQHIYPITKALCFEKGDNVSVQELENLYQSFREFCRINKGFNANQINDHRAFLNYLDSNLKKAELSTLVKLGADEKDCDIEENDALNFTNQGRKSLLWLSAKVVAANYSPQLDDIRHANEAEAKEAIFVKNAVGDIVKASKRHAFT